jgi:DNA topoisomerase-3
MDDFLYDQTTVKFEEGLTAVGRKVVNLGWRELYGVSIGNEKEEAEESAQTLPEVREGEAVKKEKEWAKKDFTKPPALFTSANLITVMRKLGLGTEATRHTYEQTLIKRGYLKREKGKLIPTPEGLKLAETIKRLSFASPEETARWEKLLSEIAFGRVDKEKGFKEFLEGIKKLTQISIKELEGEDFSYLSRKPSRKMVEYALSLAKRLGEEVDEERLKEDFAYCKEVIEELKEKAEKLPPEPPSEAQIKFAQSLAREKGLEIPQEALKDKRKMAEWLNKHAPKKKAGGRGRKGRGRRAK